MIRSLRLRDLRLITRYRHRGLFLDSIPKLTWGRGIIPLGALLSTFSSLTGVFTSIAPGVDRDIPLLCQVAHRAGSPFAHFTFLAPEEAFASSYLPELLEQLVAQVGARGAHSLTAEVEEEAPAFAALRGAGFGIYARQRIWRFDKAITSLDAENSWRIAEESDELAISLLCSSLVPGLVQQVEPSAWDGLHGYVLYHQGELMAYVDLRSGPKGKWLQPFVHLDADSIEKDLAALISFLHPSQRRPLYVNLRAYQDWLEAAIHKLGGQVGPRQAVIVKRTAKRVKLESAERLIAVKGRSTEPTMPIKIPTSFLTVDNEFFNYD